MGKSDALSRRADHGSGSDDNRDITLLTPNFFAVRATEGLEVAGEECDLLKLIQRETKSEELEDTVKQAVKALKSTSARSIHSSEWSEAEGVLYFRGKIYVPPTADIRWKIVALHHDSHIARHPGRWKTLELVARNYWWPHMSRYIGQYTATCDLCLRTKALRQLPTGHLESLPTPDTRWDTVKQAVKALKSTSARSIRSSEWSEAEGVLYFRGKIYVPPTADIRRKIVALHHDSHIAGHPGRWKTLELVARNYWWPHMSQYIGQYTATCDLCIRTKALRQLPTGHLESLPTPDT